MKQKEKTATRCRGIQRRVWRVISQSKKKIENIRSSSSSNDPHTHNRRTDKPNRSRMQPKNKGRFAFRFEKGG